MKNKKKKLFLFFLFLSGSLVLGRLVLAAGDGIIVNEIMYDPEDSDTGHTDWIELYNPSSDEIIIPKENFGLIDEKDLKLGKDGIHYLNCHSIKEDLRIDAGSFVVLTDKPEDFLGDYPDVTTEIIDGTFSLSSEGDAIKISDDKCSTFFIDLEYDPDWGGSDNGRTIEKKNRSEDYSKDNWQESYVSGGTPGDKNSQKPEPKAYSDKIRINEILPNPDGDEELNEFVEIYNDSDKSVDLTNWKIKDSSTADGFVFSKDTNIDAEDFQVVYRKDFKFALNNSGSDSVHMFDPNGKEISSVEYEDAREGVSYNFDGGKWRWSEFLTPGEENIFAETPNFQIKKDKEVFKNFPASFEVKIKNYQKNKTKIAWDFGDGHKSYKRKITHKYEKKGKYSGTVNIFNGSEEVIKSFEVKVKNFPKYDIDIVSLLPNPKGSDTEFEMITIKNNSKKKINLKNWSIATGTKKLTNHPISKKLVIKPKKTLVITRDVSKFTLNNKKAKVELRYPNGKVAYKMQYDKKMEGAAEGEILEKTNLGWVWKNPIPIKTIEIAEAIPEILEKSQYLDLAIGSEYYFPEEMRGKQSEVNPGKNFKMLFFEIAFTNDNFRTELPQSRLSKDLMSDFLKLIF